MSLCMCVYMFTLDKHRRQKNSRKTNFFYYFYFIASHYSHKVQRQKTKEALVKVSNKTQQQQQKRERVEKRNFHMIDKPRRPTNNTNWWKLPFLSRFRPSLSMPIVNHQTKHTHTQTEANVLLSFDTQNEKGAQNNFYTCTLIAPYKVYCELRIAIGNEFFLCVCIRILCVCV